MSARAAPQRGGATLAIALLLSLLALLTAGFVHRGLVFEQRSSVNQYRATQAFEAAEAGIEWSVAMLNSGIGRDANCNPVASTSSGAFSERLLVALQADRPLQAACVRAAQAWSCHCPMTGEARLPSGDGPAFVVSLTRAARTGQTQVDVRGCSQAVGCDTTERQGARAQTRALIARLPGLALPPVAALSARQEIDLRNASLGAHNTDVAGFTVHAGGAVEVGPARLVSTPGAPALASVADGDGQLAALSAPGLFASVFGMGAQAWRDQPAAKRVPCASACDEALAQALREGARLVWLDGGLRLAQAALLGTPQRPVVLVVDGDVALEAPVAIHGFVYARSAAWSAAAGTQVHGALVAEGDFAPSGTTDIHHQPATLAQLRSTTGSFARVPGSWRDF